MSQYLNYAKYCFTQIWASLWKGRLHPCESHHFRPPTTEDCPRGESWAEVALNLRNCPQGDLIKILGYKCIINFQSNFSNRWPRYFLWNCPQIIFTGPHWWWVKIDSGNGLVPSGNKPLPELMLTRYYIAGLSRLQWVEKLINNNIHTHDKLWHVIIYPCPYFNGCLAELLLKLRHGWGITHRKLWNMISHPGPNLINYVSKREHSHHHAWYWRNKTATHLRVSDKILTAQKFYNVCICNTCTVLRNDRKYSISWQHSTHKNPIFL